MPFVEEVSVALTAAAAALLASLRDLDASSLEGSEALALAGQLDRLERAVVAAKLRLAVRVVETGAWRAVEGSPRTERDWLAGLAGLNVGEAGRLLDLAEQVCDSKPVAEAFAAGDLSVRQAALVSAAVAENPAAAAGLLAEAARLPVKLLGAMCERRRREGRSVEDDAARRERHRRESFHRRWRDAEGRWNGRYRLGSDEAAARFEAALTAEEQAIFERASSEGGADGSGVRAADALVNLVTGGGASVSATVLVRADLDALQRGHVGPDEICEIDRVGPVSVQTVLDLIPGSDLRGVGVDQERQPALVHHLRTSARRRQMGAGQLLALLAEKLALEGVDVTRIVTGSRHIPEHLATALLWRNPSCAVDGCACSYRLERDHLHDHARGGPTCLANLHPVCVKHHRAKTRGEIRFEVIAPGRLRATPVGPSRELRGAPARASPRARAA